MSGRDGQKTGQPAAQGAGRAERIGLCGGRYEILPDSPLPQFSLPMAEAYAVQVVRGGGGGLVGYVVPHGSLPRHQMMSQAANLNSPHVIKFLEQDVVEWPAARRMRPVLLYERPAGAKAMHTLEEERTPLSNELGFRQMVESLFAGVREMYLAGCNHGSINPTNVYLREGGGTQMQLGDFLSAQPGAHQHPAFETVERMMALPAGRGPATSGDDVYAMGVTLLTLLLGRLPVLSLTSDELLQAKLEKGSLMALLHGMRLPGAYSELMRGMISDDPRQRWTFDDIGHWLGGRRLGNKTAGQVRKAQRGLEFAGAQYINPRLLAHAMAHQPDAAMHIIQDNTLDRWVRRSLGDEERADALTEAVASAAAVSRGGTAQERVVGRAILALDPQAPLRFRGVFALPEGVGPLLAETLMKGRPPGDIAEMISAHLINYWANLPFNAGSESISLMQIFDSQRMLLDRVQTGFGVERVAYEMNPAMPCLSPLVEAAYPLTLKALMVALEAAALRNKPEENREPMDRHLAAFILSRHRRANDRLFSLMSPQSDPGQRGLALLSIYADLQRRFYTEDMPNLAGWLVHLLTPAVERFRNRTLRERILRDLRRLAKRGDLHAMLELVDDGNTLTQDREGFEAARTHYLALDHAVRELGAGSAREKALITQGRQITAFLSSFLAFVLMGLILFLRLM